MPHAIRVFRHLRDFGLSEDKALVVAGIVEKARKPGSLFQREKITDALFDAGIPEALSEAFCDVLRNCFDSERFGDHFARTALKTSLVRGKLKADQADAFLDAIEPCIVTLNTPEVRLPIHFNPGPGRVVMCDFRHLKVPEMQKERRAIITSPRQTNDPGRCTVVPVSKTPPRQHGDQHFFRFEPGAYACFHKSDPVWALCDHLYTVSLSRLWKININRAPQVPAISGADLAAVRALVGTSLGL